MDDGHLKDLYLAYLDGSISPSEADELRKNLRDSPEKREELRELREIWIASGAAAAKDHFDPDKAFDHFNRSTGTDKRASRIPRILIRIAAAAAAIAAIVAVTTKITKHNIEDTFADINVESPAGSRTRVILPDSTEVWLNANSRLSYSQGFGVSERLVTLTGEGYFNVARDPSMPFTVKTREVNVEVLGTKFNFRDYDDEKEVIVILEEGKVALRNNLSSITEGYLLPNQRYILDKESGQGKIHVTADATRSSRWVSGNLFFDDMLLPDIAKELERNYGVHITIADKSLESCRFYGDFSKDMGIDEIIAALNRTGRIHGKREGNEIVFYQ